MRSTPNNVIGGAERLDQSSLLAIALASLLACTSRSGAAALSG